MEGTLRSYPVNRRPPFGRADGYPSSTDETPFTAQAPECFVPCHHSLTQPERPSQGKVGLRSVFRDAYMYNGRETCYLQRTRNGENRKARRL